MGNIINKLQQIFSFRCGLTPNENDFASLINSSVGVLTNPLQLPTASEAVENTVYKIGDIFFTCTRLSDNSFDWLKSSATGGVTSYNELTDKPSINNVRLGGNRTAEELRLLRDNGGYTFVRPEPSDAIPIIRAGNPFQSRVSDLISSLNAEEVGRTYNQDLTNGLFEDFFNFDTLNYVSNDKLNAMNLEKWSKKSVLDWLHNNEIESCKEGIYNDNALVASMNKEYRTHKNYIETTEDPVMTSYMLADGALNFKYFW